MSPSTASSTALSTTPAKLEELRGPVVETISTILSTMLGLDIELREPGTLGAQHPILGTVSFEGEWRGSISFACDRSQAFAFAGRLLEGSSTGTETVEDFVRDTIEEIINMVAGNFRAFLPAGTQQSIPLVVEGGNLRIHVCGERKESITVALKTPLGPCDVTLTRVH